MGVNAEILLPNKAKTRISDVVREYGKRLLGFVRKKVNSNEEAEDILQEVWYQFSNLANIDELESTSGWLYRVARNKVTDSYRKKKPDSLEDFMFETDEGNRVAKEIFFRDDSSPEMDMFKELFWEELMDALEELPTHQRDVFIWNELEDMTLQEIAEKTGENLKTIISRKGYAIKQLRMRLEYLYDDINNA